MWLALLHRKLETRCSIFSTYISNLYVVQVMCVYPLTQPLNPCKTWRLPPCVQPTLEGQDVSCTSLEECLGCSIRSQLDKMLIELMDSDGFHMRSIDFIMSVPVRKSCFRFQGRAGLRSNRKEHYSLLSQKEEISQYNRTAVTQKVGLRLQSPRGLVSWILFQITQWSTRHWPICIHSHSILSHH